MRLHSFRLYPRQFLNHSTPNHRRVVGKTAKRGVTRHVKRRVICLAIILVMFVLPVGRFIALADCTAMASPGVSAGATTGTGPWMDLVRLFSKLFGKSAKPQESTETRSNRVTSILVNPQKIVGYQGQQLAFSAIGEDAHDELVQGPLFDWASSDSSN